MFIDLHVHENLYSHCSRMSLEEAVSAAKATGLDGLCITDHDSMDIRESAADFLKKTDFPVFVGAEVSTLDGHMVVLGPAELPLNAPLFTAKEVIDFTLAHNGFCFAAHPFRYDGSGLRHKLYMLKNLPGIEVFNGGNSAEENERALACCREMGFIPVAGSDAHRPENVGRFATWLPQRVTSTRELAAALNAGLGKPARRMEKDTYAIIEPLF